MPMQLAVAAPYLSVCLALVSPAPGSWPSQALSEMRGSMQHGHGEDKEHLGTPSVTSTVLEP